MMKGKTYVLAFVTFALVDALTTWFGARAGFQEVNPLIAERLSSSLAFFGSYAIFTALGAGVIVLSLKLEKLSPAFRFIAVVMVVLKAVPAINNVLLLMGAPISSAIVTTVRPLLSAVLLR